MVKMFDYRCAPIDSFKDAYFLYVSDAESLKELLDTAYGNSEGLDGYSEGWFYWDEDTCQWFSKGYIEDRIRHLSKALGDIEFLRNEG